MLYALYRMGYKSRMTGHGFRGLAATALRELGFGRDVVEHQMAHAERNQVTARTFTLNTYRNADE